MLVTLPGIVMLVRLCALERIVSMLVTLPGIV